MKTWIVNGLFVSLPDKKESWSELECFSTYEDALGATKNINACGVTIRGYHGYRIIERSYTDKLVFEDRDE